ncbi:hypothetical protein ScPMuIL_000896 [Solemya velum]
MANFRVHHIRFFEVVPKPINCLTYEPHTEKIALSRSDGSIEIWSVCDNWFQEKIILAVPDHSVEALVWQGTQLYSAGLTGHVTKYSLNQLKPEKSCSSNAGPVWCLVSNASEDKLAAGTEEGCVVLFDTANGDLQYYRAFDKQEGRIFSLAWHVDEEIIVTGGIDNIRMWSVNSGHAIQRLTLGRQEKNKETIVWCIAITSDMTIISGDSRGKTCFWNGRQGTLILGVESNKADVLCLAVSPEENSVFTSGIDPTVVQFELTPISTETDRKAWVSSLVRTQHTHDVRALVFAGKYLASGGVDTALITNLLVKVKGTKSWFRYSGFQHVGLLRTLFIVVGKILEKWFGHLFLLVVIANLQVVFIYRLTILNVYFLQDDKEFITPKLSLTKVKVPTGMLLPAHHMVLTCDGRTLITATCEGTIQLTEVGDDLATLSHTFPSENQPIHLLQVSLDGLLIAAAYGGKQLCIYNTQLNKKIYTLPNYKCQASAMGFSQNSQELVVAYTDQMILEYDMSCGEYTDWSRSNTKTFPIQWQKRHSKISHITHNPRNNQQVILHDEQMFCILDKTVPMTGKDARLYSKSSWQTHGDSNIDKTPKPFHICNKYKYLLHLDTLTEDWLVAVERTPSSILDTLPPVLGTKKFGT